MFRPLSWLPLRYIIRKAAKSQGFLDPIEIMARLRSLAQPSEVGEPIELLRAGVVFHARGLINSKVIQHNLDWVWPYWVERQYDPRDIAFTPRAFSVTHVNLTNRNWTAIGYPDSDELPIVDPRGMLTPLLDGWSLDVWVISDDGRTLLPSRLERVEQTYVTETGLEIVTTAYHEGLSLILKAQVIRDEDSAVPVCQLTVSGADDRSGTGKLVVSLRPCNPEGISFINAITLSDDCKSWRVNDSENIQFSKAVPTSVMSNYHNGDVFFLLDQPQSQTKTQCDVGLASAAAVFDLERDSTVTVSIPLGEQSGNESVPVPETDWQNERSLACQFRCPDSHYEELWNQAISSLILHSPRDVYPGPYTYKRFWFRDAAFIIHALMAAGFNDRARRAIDQFFGRQTALGYFRSQEGEWDSNGEVLWILRRYQLLSGTEIPADWRKAIIKGGKWITRKLLDEELDAPHAGLLPAGFSAEHLGPNDFYYWDDFWSIAGLESAADMLSDGDDKLAREFSATAKTLRKSVDRSLASCATRLGRPAMPASPYRRLDAGAIGSIAAGYPLQVFSSNDPRLTDCLDYLLDNCFIDDAFFQDMIHSGLNAYLTLEAAQVLLRAGDSRYLKLMDSVAELASPTGQWPEAIHPQTRGGCMGDGHHVWASAEWVLMIRNCFVREESGGLILCGGIPERWLTTGAEIEFGPAQTEFGSVSLKLDIPSEGQVQINWSATWHDEEPEIEICLPGYTITDQKTNSVLLVANEPDKAA